MIRKLNAVRIAALSKSPMRTGSMLENPGTHSVRNITTLYFHIRAGSSAIPLPNVLHVRAMLAIDMTTEFLSPPQVLPAVRKIELVRKKPSSST